MSSTVSLHRVLMSPVSRVIRAFSHAEGQGAWTPPFGFICQVHSFNFKVGGDYRMSFINFTTEQKHLWSGVFESIKNNELIIFKETFDNPKWIGEMTTTVFFKEMCYLGWQESLIKLAQLVEPEING